MAENVILGLFALAPCLTAGAMFLFFVKFRQHQKTGRRALRLVVGNLLILSFLLSLGLPLGEAYYRYIYDTTESFALAKVSQRWFNRYFLKNEIGVRDSVSTYAMKRTAGIRRITFIGDSFTAGQGVANVEDRYCNLIRAKRPEWEIHIMARPAMDTGDQLDGIGNLIGRGYEFDHVVLAYCLNDVSELVPEWQEAIDRIYQQPTEGFFLANSYLINTWYYRWKVGKDPDLSRYFRYVLEAYDGPLWKVQRARLRRLKGLIESQGGRLLVVTFPFFHTLGADYPYRSAHEKLGALWGESSVPHLDLLETFKSSDRRKLVVNPHDSHPNERAHTMAATAILEFLNGQQTIASQPMN